jgi:glyceraldehyde-3-phosphate dehydrogenase (NAD(P)+) (phosphorylating)
MVFMLDWYMSRYIISFIKNGTLQRIKFLKKRKQKMSNKKIKVAVNGYGVIGKRVADAIRIQPDMELVGVADVVSDYRVKAAVVLGLPVYVSIPEKSNEMKNAGIPIAGNLSDLLKQIDVIVDCTPKGIGAKNLELYKKTGVKAIYQGGEKHSLTGHSFVAQANYETALGLDATRVVSCNTTSTVRTLIALRNAGLLKKARGVLIRRATDPWESDHSGIMNTVVPEPHIPSHQGPDAQTVVPELDVITMAVKASHTQTHNHYWVVELNRETSDDEVLAAFKAVPRIAFIRMSDGIVALNSTIELMKDLGRPRGDMWEVALWEDVLTVNGNEVYYTYQVYNEAIVVPETIDAIRALMGTIKDGSESIRITDEAMGMRKDFLIK